MITKSVLKSTLLALAAAILAIAVVGCRGNAAPPPPTPSVTIAPVEQKELVEWDKFAGWDNSRMAIIAVLTVKH